MRFVPLLSTSRLYVFRGGYRILEGGRGGGVQVTVIY